MKIALTLGYVAMLALVLAVARWVNRRNDL